MPLISSLAFVGGVKCVPTGADGASPFSCHSGYLVCVCATIISKPLLPSISCPKLLEYIIPGCAPSTNLGLLELHSGDSWCQIFRIGVDTSSDLIASAPLPESALRFREASAPALFFFTTCLSIVFTPIIYYLFFSSYTSSVSL